MDNNNNQNNPSNGQSDEGKKPGGTLDLQNISIKTLKDDLAGEAGDAKEDKSGWFNFLAKHKAGPQQTAPPKGDMEAKADSSETKTEINPEIGKSEIATEIEINGEPGIPKPLENSKEDSSPLDKELDQFKAETEGNKTEAPFNLPISDSPIISQGLGGTEKSNLGAEKSEPVQTITGESATETQALPDERPALGSFFPARPAEATEEGKPEAIEPENNVLKNKLSEALSGSSENKLVSPFSNPDSDTSSEKKIKLFPDEGISGVAASQGEAPEVNPNPFSTRLQKAEPEKKSLLQSVESALNYSAPPEFNDERSKIETGATETDSSGQVVDLRKKPNAKVAGLLGNKKMVVIFGGVGVVVLLVIVTLVVVMSSNKTPTKPVTSPVAQENKNANSNPNPVPTINPSTPQPKATLTAQKVLANSLDISIGSLDAIEEELTDIRGDKGVQKQTQLVFLKSDGSAVSFQDLINSTGINIPQKVLPQPSTVPALIFADFFKGQTILGLIIPTSDTTEQAVSKMKNWESTMVIDLGDLWKGVTIDNHGAYFADSQLFENSRFALIDKKSRLSLDYSIENGYIFIACGKDSMTILQKQFTAPSASDSGIIWEGEESVKTNGVDTGSNKTSGSSTDSSGNNSGLSNVAGGSDTTTSD